MHSRILRLKPPAEPRPNPAFARIRDQFDIPREFPEAVLRAADEAAGRPLPEGRLDMREIEFFTIDPPGSRDLDQAMHLERRDDGFRLRYAIADVAVFVDRGGVIEAEAWRRGETVYCPDVRVPLYPTVLSEGAASLLAGADRPALVFTIDLDATGERTAGRVDRAIVRSREQLTYAGIPAAHIGLLRAIGELRIARLIARGGVELQVPEQIIVPDPASPGAYEIELATRVPSEDWNAQMSLLAGMVAADIMLAGHVGLLRTMGGVDEYRLAALRRSAAALGVPWPEEMSYGAFVRTLDPARPRPAALLSEARGVMGHAAYTAFDGDPPAQPLHSALACTYAHATAPMRRLADRYVLDLLAELSQGERPDAAQIETLEKLPAAMAASGARNGQLERTMVDEVEVRMLQNRVGDVFPASVTDVDHRGAHIWITDPVVKARLKADPPPPPGTSLDVRLTLADERARALQFVAA